MSVYRGHPHPSFHLQGLQSLEVRRTGVRCSVTEGEGRLKDCFVPGTDARGSLQSRWQFLSLAVVSQTPEGSLNTAFPLFIDYVFKRFYLFERAKAREIAEGEADSLLSREPDAEFNARTLRS